MKSVTLLPGLADLKTTISAHVRSLPRHRGSTYLELLSLGMERLRLEAELAWLAKRQGRIGQRLQESREATTKLLGQVEQESSGVAPPPLSTPGENRETPEESSQPGKWRTVTLEY